MHDRNEGICYFAEFLVGVYQLIEQFLQRLEVLKILVGLGFRCRDFLMKFGKRGRVSAFVLFEELEHFLDALRRELVTDRIQIIALVLPEVQLLHGVGVASAL